MTLVHTGAQLTAAATSITSPAIDTTGMTLLVVCTANYHTPQDDAATPISDNKGNTYTLAVNHATGILYNNIYYCNSATPNVGSGHTFTYTVTATDFLAIAVLASDGTGAAPLDQTSSGGGSFLTPAIWSPPLATTSNNEIIVGFQSDDDSANTITIANTGTSAATWVQDERIDGNSGQGFTLFHAIVTTTGSYQASTTTNLNASQVILGASFVSGAVPPAGPPSNYRRKYKFLRR